SLRKPRLLRLGFSTEQSCPLFESDESLDDFQTGYGCLQPHAAGQSPVQIDLLELLKPLELFQARVMHQRLGQIHLLHVDHLSQELHAAARYLGMTEVEAYECGDVFQMLEVDVAGLGARQAQFAEVREHDQLP